MNRLARSIIITLPAAMVLGCGLSPHPWAGPRERIEPPSLRDIAAARRTGPHTLILPTALVPPDQRVAEAVAPTRRRSLIPEIDGATHLASAWQRRQVYRQLATERGMDDASQRHLVNATLDHLASETAKEEILLVLITNPDFSPAAEELILQRLVNFAAPSRRQRILAAMPRFRTVDPLERDLLGWLWDKIW